MSTRRLSKPGRWGSVEIKPIETHYAGCRFRSRLEARWAVFFDAYGVEWVYEPQGYETRTGRYLPDFWLPAVSCWVDVKGQLDDAAWGRLCGAIWDLPAEPADLTAKAVRATPILLILGDIPHPEDAARAIHTSLRWGIGQDLQPRTLAQLCTFVHPDYIMPIVWPTVANGWSGADDLEYIRNPRSNGHVVARPALADAFDRARRARFEFGESG
jgi:hypothetical protein